MLADMARHSVGYVILRYSNGADADAAGQARQSSARPTHLSKLASRTVTGQRAAIEIFGDGYPTRDGPCIHDHMNVVDLVDAHVRR